MSNGLLGKKKGKKNKQEKIMSQKTTVRKRRTAIEEKEKMYKYFIIVFLRNYLETNNTCLVPTKRNMLTTYSNFVFALS